MEENPFQLPGDEPPRRSTFAEWGALAGAALGVGAAICIASGSMAVNLGVVLLGGMAGIGVGAVLDWKLRGRSPFAVLPGQLRRRCFEVGVFVGLLWGILAVIWKDPQTSQDWFIALMVIFISIVVGAVLGLALYPLLRGRNPGRPREDDEPVG